MVFFYPDGYSKRIGWLFPWFPCQVKLSGPHQGFMEHMERYRCPGTGWEHQARKMGSRTELAEIMEGKN